MAHYVLVDANNMAFQSQTAAMDKKNRSKRLYCGEKETTAINGVLSAMRETQSKFPDATMLMLWDTGKAWRYGIYPDYKGNRKTNETLLEAKEALESQREDIMSIMDLAGIPQVTAENYEADDIGAFMADLLANKGHKVTLITRDQDWLQMVRQGVRWYDRFSDRLVTNMTFEADIGFATPAQFSESKIFKGDAGDNVSGIKGVGPVAAEHLVQIFGTPEALIEKWEEWVADGGLDNKHPLNRQRKAIQTFLADCDVAREKMSLNRKLMDLRIMFGNREIAKRIRKTRAAVDLEALQSHLSRLAFVKIVTNLEGWLAPFRKA